MPRLPRIHIQGAVHYVTLQGSQSREIFKDKADYKVYLDLLNKYKSQHHFKLFSYCLLPDSLHLLIETGDNATISEVMHDLNSLYTKYFNGRYQKRGSLFESRFKSVLVEKTNYLLQMTRQVHLAQEKATLAANSIGGAGRMQSHPYNSYNLYVPKAQGDSESQAQKTIDIFEEMNEVMSFLRNKNNEASYERYCLSGNEEEIAELDKKLRRGSILGSDSFEAEVRRRIEQYSKDQKDEVLAAKRPFNLFVFIIGAGILLASVLAITLYVSKKSLEEKYATLLAKKEAEFAEKSRFKNRSPIALSDLEGTIWEIEMLPLAGVKTPEIVKDHLRFSQGHFSSDNYSASGFSPTNFSRTIQPGSGVVIWETIQSNAAGDTVSWRGDWQGDAMKGVLSFTPVGKNPKDFSFFSVKWDYAEIGK